MAFDACSWSTGEGRCVCVDSDSEASRLAVVQGALVYSSDRFRRRPSSCLVAGRSIEVIGSISAGGRACIRSLQGHTHLVLPLSRLGREDSPLVSTMRGADSARAAVVVLNFSVERSEWASCYCILVRAPFQPPKNRRAAAHLGRMGTAMPVRAF